ncbi:DUF433 domain-containing protein [Dyadobacter pollutisoli]|jgi:uncharacterized protein (DUF433 family)|uniref:DUF433 domain-containing protein n=1 Tax=Dyadobacter pollutisoli TaxID=2910158 RepID=A0A9E8N699_9BACT|nr:DUF433 domain-containing protein [Dyadobacter pollutisoli]WAC10580.1 DUF433 domain-containing protein [Dyadobacter pollutisoli]
MKSDTDTIFGLGTGIYTIPDIAAILGLPQAKVRRWLHEYWNAQFGKFSPSPFSDGSGRDLITNFYTLIEFFAFYQLREEGVSTQRIIKAHQVLEKALQTNYPFAKSDIFTDGIQVLFAGEVGEIIKADETLQLTIKEVFEPFCKKVDFNKNHFAERFFPLGKEHKIIIDPKRQFGQPVIGGTNVLTETVFNLFRGGESIEVIVGLYDLTVDQVEDAIHFHRNVA